MTKTPPATLTDSIDAILTQWGVPSDDILVRATAEVLGFAQERGLRVQVRGVRYGVLTLVAAPADAHFIRLDLDLLRARLEQALPATVTAIRIRSDLQSRRSTPSRQ